MKWYLDIPAATATTSDAIGNVFVSYSLPEEAGNEAASFAQAQECPRGGLSALAAKSAEDNPRSTRGLFETDPDSDDLSALAVNTALCFSGDTFIVTPRGEIAARDLRSGDLVLTVDSGFKEILWTGSIHVTAEQMRAQCELRPICITAGSLGAGYPARDLIVSQEHRILLRSKLALSLFGERDVLIPAKQLLLREGVEICQNEQDVDYIQFIFDRHELVFSNGAQSESLLLCTEGLKAFAPKQRKELQRIFPDLERDDGAERTVRHILTAEEQVRFLREAILDLG